MKPIHTLCIGEILMDLLPSGARLGGAPANVAWHANRFGAESLIVSRIGSDPTGARILEQLKLMGMETKGITTDDVHPTGQVDVTVDDHGKPTYFIHEDTAWDFIELGPDVLKTAAHADAVCFGSLAQRSEVSRQAIQTLLAATSPDCLRFFDINLRQAYFSEGLITSSLKLANALKLNDEELPILAKYYGLTGSDLEMASALAERFSLRLVALTRGSKGSLLLAGNETSEHPGCPTTVVDSVGAGDCFTAATMVGFSAGKSLDEINEIANQAAAFVCGSSGATPVLPEGWRIV
ncbi:MAG TPA: carbohydrate kinase [Luteolibacter sp.]|nr:carbohydrate kinase [Luteolibacter sp.]